MLKNNRLAPKLSDIVSVQVPNFFPYKDEEYSVKITILENGGEDIAILDKVLDRWNREVTVLRECLCQHVKNGGIFWEDIYGYLLPEIKWYDHKENIYYGTGMMFIHKNGTEIVKLIIPLPQQSYKNIKDFNFLCSYKKVLIASEVDNEELIENPEDLYAIVFKYLQPYKGTLKFTKKQNFLLNFIIPRTNQKCLSLENPSNEYKEMIYCMANAPYQRTLIGKKELNTFWRDNRKEFSEIAYFFAGNHVCVSVASERVYLEIKDHIKNEDEKESFLAEVLGLNIDIIMHMLLLFQKCLVRYEEFDELNYENYLRYSEIAITNIKYFYQCMEDSMGTIRATFEFAKDHMEYYLRPKEFELKTKLYEKYIMEREEKTNKKNQEIKNDESRRISLLGMGLTLIFGLPSIYNGLHIIRSCLSISNLPYITMEGVSFFLWITLLIGWNVILNSNRDPRK